LKNNFLLFQTRLTQVENIIKTTETLRRVTNFLQVLKEIKKELNQTEKDYSVLSNYLFEMERIIESKDLNGIQVLVDNKEFIEKLTKEVKLKGKEFIQKGLASNVSLTLIITGSKRNWYWYTNSI
jgi:hypothetical protein